MLSLDYLRTRISYDPETGKFVWISHRYPSYVGKELRAKQRGYLVVRLNDFSYRLQRIAFLFMLGRWPVGVVDHINRNKQDNRWANLRDVPQKVNVENVLKAGKHNLTGLRGVSKTYNVYQARIRFNGKSINLGCFETPQAAYQAYLKAKRIYHGDSFQ